MRAVPDAPLQRHAIRVRGSVQGVGFRPFVYRIACEEGLQGWVLNDAEGVLVEAQGPADALARFEARLRSGQTTNLRDDVGLLIAHGRAAQVAVGAMLRP